ncbi:MAG: class I SAM-dependent methyltransferase, partial [Chthoniobacteraceae bacterium]
ADLPPFRGVHFSNELIDAMPVHLVKYTGGAWKERHIDWQDDRFAFLDAPLSSPQLAAHLQSLPLTPVEGYTTEINLDALCWIDSLASRLESGYTLIIDYGWPRDIFYAPDRTTGTLTCYSQHKRSYDPLQNTGNSDITAHVDFTTLAERAEAAGFHLSGFADQHHFMVGLGKQEFPDTDQPADEARRKSLRAFHTLMHPALMGLAFKFLALEKNLPQKSGQPLAGFQFSPNPKAALGN